MQEGILKEHLEAAQRRADEAWATASLEERVVLQAQQQAQAKALRKAQVRCVGLVGGCVGGCAVGVLWVGGWVVCLCVDWRMGG